MDTNPTSYGLNSRVKLVQLADDQIGIEKRIKSRIIQKDALKIIEMANSIKEKESGLKVSLICNENICSKSIKVLNDNGIEVIH